MDNIRIEVFVGFDEWKSLVIKLYSRVKFDSSNSIRTYASLNYKDIGMYNLDSNYGWYLNKGYLI